jgi:uncharacterized protein YggU (UPF0235/DUF167 family)
MSIKETVDGVLITVFVKPNSPKFSIQFDGNEIVVHATEETRERKSKQGNSQRINKAFFHAKVELVSGATSRQKNSWQFWELKKTI